MMRRPLWINVVILMLPAILGCASSSVPPSVIAVASETKVPLAALTPNEARASATAHVSSPAATLTPQTILTAGLTPPPTLLPQQANVAIRELLQSPACPAPCFWGITPRRTTLAEARQVLAHLALSLTFTIAEDSKEFYESAYEFDSGLAVVVIFGVEDHIIVSVNADIEPEIAREGNTLREWLAYSPEALIRQYGPPSRIEFWGGMSHEIGAEPNLHYLLDMYFDPVDLIVSYNSAYDFVKIDPATNLVRVCPLTDQFQGVRIWSGENPEHPPLSGPAIEETLSMSVEDFSAMLTGEPNDACFDVSRSLFGN